MTSQELNRGAFFWALQAICTLYRKPFSIELAQQQLAAPYTTDSLVRAAQAYGFEAASRKARADKLHKESFPLIVWLNPKLPGAAEPDALPHPIPICLKNKGLKHPSRPR